MPDQPQDEKNTDQPLNNNTFALESPHLDLYLPDGTQRTLTLKNTLVRIGKASNADIFIPETAHHQLEIQLIDKAYHITDFDRASGIKVNGEAIDHITRLNHKDEIRFPAGDDEARMVYHVGFLEYGSEFATGGVIGDNIQSPAFDQEKPEGVPYLQIRWMDGQTRFFEVKSPVVLVGRSHTADLEIPLSFVSSRHFEIRQNGIHFDIIDLDSTNGTRVNSKLLTPQKVYPLLDGAIIRIGNEVFGVSIGLTFYNPAEQQLPFEGFSPTRAMPSNLIELKQILIGRGQDCDVILDSAQVSRHHARIIHLDNHFQLTDLDSRNGTYLNGERVTSTEIKNNDLIEIGQHILLFRDGKLTPYESQGIRIDVKDLVKEVKTSNGNLRILDDISMTVMPRDFVAIVGGSGAGKSTLMNALIGIDPAAGELLINGANFYTEYDRYRSQFGYIPQADILHTTLTVEQALNYAAQMRLPSDISDEERQTRISRVLDTVDMNTDVLRQTRIGNLSGGQRKRVSIAAELLADPKLIYLDEATSGLDPGLEKKMMYTLRRMADEGRTVVLITHATANIIQVDHVAFISQGKLVYFGPPQDTLDFFEVDDFADIYERIEGDGQHWRKVFQQDKPEHYQQYVIERQAPRQTRNAPPAPTAEKAKSSFDGDFVRQLGVLTRRMVTILRSDLITLGLLLLLFPLTAFLQLLISTPDILTGNLAILADPIAAAITRTTSYIPIPDVNTFVFVMGLEAVLVGMYVPSNELIKERAVYLRERMVNLGVAPYLLSKVLVFGIFAAVQCVLYLMVLGIGVHFPSDGLYLPGVLELFITLFLTMMAGIGLGLVVSSLSNSNEMATYLLVMLLFFQFFFAGTVFDLRDNPVEPLSYFTTTRWSLLALGITIDMEEMAESTILCNTSPDPSATPTCFNYPNATEDLLLPYKDENLVISWAILIVMAMIGYGTAGILIKRQDKT